jgi:Ca-activated chloride channel homolog
MRSLLPIILSLTWLTLQAACAQSADDFFNSGAQFYISNNIANAKQAVEGGLKLYPNDVKLKKLEELLKKQSQQQQQQQQQQQNQNQQQQNQQNQQQSQQNQNQQQQSRQPSQQNQQQPNQQSQPDQQAQNQSGRRNDQQQNQQPQPSSGQPNEKTDGQNGQTQASAAREMSPEEVQRLLDTQKGDEQFLQLKPQSPPESRNRPIKDW